MLIPPFTVQDLQALAAFSTGAPDFTLAMATTPKQPFSAGLARGSDELHPSRPTRRPPSGRSAIVACDDVDTLSARFRARGLKPCARTDS